MLGTNDLSRSTRFYEALLSPLGGHRAFTTDQTVAWRFGRFGALISLTLPHDGKLASAGNGVMVAIALPERITVDEAHAKAIALGAANEGAPGVRGASHYSSYVRDLDGNKLSFFHLPRDE